jgi:hypothetical protein
VKSINPNKTCTKCNQQKSISLFYKNRPDCKQCLKERSNLYRLNNKEKCKKSVQNWLTNNKYKKYEIDKSWRAKNTDRVAENKKIWRELHKDRENSMAIIKYKTNLQHKLRVLLRSRLNQAVKSQKNGSATRDLGCSIDELKIYLEYKFQPGMSWDNYGPKGWHIDHIRPLSSFDLSNREQLKIACHYSNLQPLWAADNLKKGKTYSACSSCSTVVSEARAVDSEVFSKNCISLMAPTS